MNGPETGCGGLLERHAVVNVSATTGAGKTTAIAGAVLGQSRPVAWLAVDRTDTAPGRLVTYLEAALARAVPGVERVATGAMSAGVHAAEAAGLLAEAVGDAGVVFVLDKLERLGEADEAWAVIESLLRYAPDGLRAVLASRRAIPPDVTVLTSGRPRVAEVGETDLRFTEEEAADALARLADLCGCPHKSAHAETSVMPRDRRDRRGGAGDEPELSA